MSNKLYRKLLTAVSKLDRWAINKWLDCAVRHAPDRGFWFLVSGMTNRLKLYLRTRNR